MERIGDDGMKLHREKYPGDFIPYSKPELFQGCEKLEKYTWGGREPASASTSTRCAYHYTPKNYQ
jgi:hypothetical protein